MPMIKDDSFERFENEESIKQKGNDFVNGDVKNDEVTKTFKMDQLYSYFKLFQYGDKCDLFGEALATLMSISVGMIFPGSLFLSGLFHDTFTEYGKCKMNQSFCSIANATLLSESQWSATINERFEKTSIEYVNYILILAVSIAVLAIVQITLWTYTANRQVHRLQMAFFRSVLNQDISYHDVVKSGKLNTTILNNFRTIREGMGEKTGLAAQYIAEGIASLVVALIASWKLTLITFFISSLLIIASTIWLKVGSQYTRKQQEAYKEAGAIAAEAISNIHTVTSFGGQKKVADRYSTQLSPARAIEIKKGIFRGFFNGLNSFIFLFSYGVVFFFGSLMIMDGEVTPGQVIISFTGTLITASCLGKTSAFLIEFSAAKEAEKNINKTLTTIPKKDIFSEKGVSPKCRNGEIKFKNVSFTYPSREKLKILNGLSFTITPGTTVAIVGKSGIGKSTIIQLIQRFYDCTEGEITVGGENVTNLSLYQHRDQIGVVSQEPVLFATTIAENIRWGRDGVTDEEMHEAAKQANAYDFIMKLPKKFETTIAEGGGCLSGGQKQRIAIARAIVRNPKILLLDEATSALDTESESIVQETLKKASYDRTTVIVAHRLSTIRAADKIIVIDAGKVVQEGNHRDLYRNKSGLYYNLAESQKLHKSSFTGDQDIPDDASAGQEKITKKRKISLSKSLITSLGFGPSKKSEISEGDNWFWEVLKYNKHEWAQITIACLFSLMAGAAMPLAAFMYADFLKNSILNDEEEQKRNALMIGIMYAGLAGILFLAVWIEETLFAKSGAELTIRLRHKAFQALLRQDIEFFNDPENNAGSLCAQLSEDAANVHGCTGVRIGIILKNISTLVVSLGIAFLVNWKLTLVIMGFAPCVAFAELLKARITKGSNEEDLKQLNLAGKISIEAINNIRTVTSYNKQNWFCERYNEEIKKLLRTNLRKSLSAGFIYGFYQSILFFAYAAAFRMGIYLLISDQITFDEFFKVLVAIVFGSLAVGENSVLAPDYGKAKLSAKRILKLLRRKPGIDSYSDDGLTPVACHGEVKFTSVRFSYPRRPKTNVLKRMTIKIEPGKTLALVGSSGCGKTTSINLLQRFFNAQTGIISIDGVDVRKLNVQWLRHQMGVVSQEPVLFDQSVADNIRFGDCSREVSQEEIEEVAEKADIHNSIMDLTEGYETRVGAKGGQLSGGQKQRIAIARALLRNPKILILDEATSALDAESEKTVHEALEVARKGRTCIVIAHRLSTVRSADRIAVIDNGVVVEVGTHDQLLAKGGTYYSLFLDQQRLQRTVSVQSAC